MSKHWFLAAVVVLTLAFRGGVSAQNICPNPGMENSNAGWKSGTFPDRWETNLQYLTTDVYAWEASGVGRSGRCISITNPAAGFPTGNAWTSGVKWISTADGLALDGSKSYDVSVWVKKTADVKLRLVAAWYSANKNTKIGGSISGDWDTATAGGDWVPIHASAAGLMPPYGAAYLEFNFEIVPNTVNTGTVYIDDASVTANDSGLPAYGSLSGQVTYNSAGVANAIVGVKSSPDALTDGQYYALTDSSGNYSVYLPTPFFSQSFYAAAVKMPGTVLGENGMPQLAGYVAYSATDDYAFTLDENTTTATHNFALQKPLGPKLEMRAASIVSADPNDTWRPTDGLSAGGDRWLVNATGAGDYVIMDLGANIPVSMVNICQWSGQRAQAWTLSWSTDNLTYTPIKSVASGSTGGYTNSSMWELIKIPETSARYWKMTRDTATAGQWVITEFELYSELSGTVQGRINAGGVAFNKAIVGLRYRRADSPTANTTLADADFYALTDASGNYSVPVSNGTFDAAAWPHQDTYTANAFIEAWAPTISPTQVVVNGNTQTANINCVDGLGPNPSYAKTTDTSLVTSSGDTGNRMGVFNGNRLDTDWNPGAGSVYGTVTTGAYITRDLGATPPSIDTVILSWTGNRANRQFAISYSPDNSTWTPAYTATYSNGGFPATTSALSRNGNWTIIRLDSAIAARYWRVTPLVRGGPYTDWNAIHELELYKSTAPPGKISGTVTIGGVAAPNAIVGYKLASKGGYALADAPSTNYIYAGADGAYATPTLTPGDYIIAAWPTLYDNPVGTGARDEKYAMSDNVAVTVSGDKVANFNITKGLGPDVARTTNAALVTASEVGTGNGLSLQPFNVWRYGGDYWGVSTAPGWITRDLGANPPTVDTFVIGTGRDNWASSYTIDSSDNGSTWTPRYSETVATGGLQPNGHDWDRCEYVKLPAPITARYWRLSANTFNASTWQLAEWEIYGTTDGLPGFVQGTVKANGVLYPGAVVGIKTTTIATADADVQTHTNDPLQDNYYFRTDANGAFGPTIQLPYGTYKVAAYIEGYQTIEQTVTVNSNTTNLTFDLTALIGFNKAATQPALDSQGTSATRLNDGIRLGGDFWNETSTDNPQSTPMWARVDLGQNEDINQILIQWVYDRVPASYKIQYATDDGSGIEPDPVTGTWNDWYSTAAARGFICGAAWPYDRWDVVQQGTTSARWWRIWSNTGHAIPGTDPQEWNMGVRELLIYSATEIPAKIMGVVKDSGGAPIYNAIVRLDKSDGAMTPVTMITDTDGRYEVDWLAAGAYSVAADALGYAASRTSKAITDGEAWVNDITLTTASETGAFNPGMETADGSLPAGWRAWPDNATNVDYYQYTGEKKSGSASFAASRNASSVGTPISAQCMTQDQWIPVSSNSAYNIYFWAKTSGASKNGSWSAIWLDASGTEISRLHSELAYTEAWKPYIIAYTAVPPTGAAYLDVQAGAVFGQTEDTTNKMMIDDVVVDSISLPRISDIKGQIDGSAVSLTGLPVTYSPTMAGIVADSFFYIEQPDRSSGIRVENHSSNATPLAGSTVTLAGTIATNGSTGERYLSIDSLSSGGTDNDVSPLGVNTRAISEDAKLAGQLIRTSGVVQDMGLYPEDGLQWFTISDGYTKNGSPVTTKARIGSYFGDPSLTNAIKIGDFVKLTGVVSQEGATTKLIILRNFSVQVQLPANPPHSWSTGFEPGESYTTGTLVGQNGWTYGYDYGWNGLQTAPIGNATATVVNSSTGAPVMGTQALKLNAPNTYTVNLLNMGDEVTVRHLTTTDDLKYVIFKFKLWRDPGTQYLPYTDGTAGDYPTIRSNTVFWWTQDTYSNAGWQWDISYNTQPWADGGGSVPTRTGRYTEVVEYIDFVAQKVSTWYDGVAVDDQKVISTNGSLQFTDIEFLYIATQPLMDGAYGRPAYIDDVYVGWSTTADP